MVFRDNIVKEYLRNVYFITGTPCGGKTTISKALGEKYGIPVYDVDEKFEIHKSMSNEKFQPVMNRNFKNADEFFGRSIDEYKNWLLGNTREQLDFVLMDCIRLSQNNIILCDCHLTLEEAEQITDLSRIVFMIKEPKDLVDDYCNRPDHQRFREFIHSATDFEKAKKTCNDTLFAINGERYKKIKESHFFWLERNDKRSVSETMNLVEKHFGFV